MHASHGNKNGAQCYFNASIVIFSFQCSCNSCNHPEKRRIENKRLEGIATYLIHHLTIHISSLDLNTTRECSNLFLQVFNQFSTTMPSQRKPSQSVFNLRAALGVGNKTQTGGRGNGAAALRIQKYNNRTDRDNVDRIKKKKNEKYTSSKVRASVRSANAPKPTESGSKGIRQTLVCASCLRGPSGPSDPFCNVRQVVFVR